jgi:hypothetical protein
MQLVARSHGLLTLWRRNFLLNFNM